MSKGGAPAGNQNAKKGKDWETALRYALDTYQTSQVERGQALREIGKKLIEKALDGDSYAIKEIGDRLDGKPAQAITGEGGKDLFPPKIEIVNAGNSD